MDWRTLFSRPKAAPSPQTVDPGSELRQFLRTALQPFMGTTPAELATDFLHSAGADEWMNIDQRLRSYSSRIYIDWRPGTVQSIVSCPLSHEERQSLLFLACSHHDGRERQKAVWHLTQFPGLLTLAAALIRTVDWVPEVRYAARDRVIKLLGACAAGDVLSVWPVVLRLQNRERSNDGWLVEAVEGWILESTNSDLLRRARASMHQDVRAWAYRKSIERGDALLYQEALMQSNPRIGLHALRHAQAALSTDSIAALAGVGLDAPHPAVRRECLRALASTDTEAATAAMRCLLLDRSAGVRRLAAYLMRQSGSDARTVWRAALDNPSSHFPIGALASLAEEAETIDATRFRRLLPAVRVNIRQYALKGLLRIDQSISPEEITQLLQPGGSRVLAVLAGGIRDSAIPLDTSSMLRILANRQLNDDGRANLRRLLETDGLWDCLGRLLALRVHDTDKPWWIVCVDDWIGRRGAYAPLGGIRNLALLTATAERAEDLGPDRVLKIEAALHRY